MVRPACAAGLACVVLAAPVSSRQTQAPDAARVVLVHVTVLDTDGRPVTGLKADDFQLVDDGKPQAIVHLADPAPAPSVLVAVDLSESMRERVDLMLGAANELLGRLGPGARARVVVFSNSAVMNPPPGQPSSTTPGTIVAGMPAQLDIGPGTRLWDTLRIGLGELERDAGRRVVVICSDGSDNRSDQPDPRDIVARVREQNHQVHVLVPRTRYFNGRAWVAIQPDRSLRPLATNSGGVYQELQRPEDLQAALGRLAEDLRHQYELGFVPSPQGGRTRRLEVRVTRSGLSVSVRARREYMSPREE